MPDDPAPTSCAPDGKAGAPEAAACVADRLDGPMHDAIEITVGVPEAEACATARLDNPVPDASATEDGARRWESSETDGATSTAVTGKANTCFKFKTFLGYLNRAFQ